MWTMVRAICPGARSILLLLLLQALLVASSVSQTHWVGSWASSQQLVEPHNSFPAADLQDATLRQIVHLSIGGPRLRVIISNRFGTAPLHFTGVHIARPESPASAKTVAETDKPVTFSGAPDVTVPAGADYISDAINFPVAPLSDLAIT